MKNLLVEIETKIGGLENFNYQTIFSCVGFWNKEGKDIYEKNKKGELGTAFTNEKANKLTYEEYILECLYNDYKVIDMFKTTEYTFGKGSSHIWIHSTKFDKRLMLIRF